MAYLLDLKQETTSPNSLGELKKIPLRRRTHTPIRGVRRTGELQRGFDFDQQRRKKATTEIGMGHDNFERHGALPEPAHAKRGADGFASGRQMACFRSLSALSARDCGMNEEVFKLRCYNCRCEVEIPTSSRECVRCGVTLTVDWSGERESYQKQCPTGAAEPAKQQEHAA